MLNFPFHSETRNNCYKQSHDRTFCHTLYKNLPLKFPSTPFVWVSLFAENLLENHLQSVNQTNFRP